MFIVVIKEAEEEVEYRVFIVGIIKMKEVE